MKKAKKVINWGKIKRDMLIEAGANDNRFVTKVVKNKKKEASKTACRGKIE